MKLRLPAGLEVGEIEETCDIQSQVCGLDQDLEQTLSARDVTSICSISRK